MTLGDVPTCDATQALERTLNNRFEATLFPGAGRHVYLIAR